MVWVLCLACAWPVVSASVSGAVLGLGVWMLCLDAVVWPMLWFCAWPVVWLLAWVLCLACGLACGLASVSGLWSGAVLGMWSGMCLACGLAFGLGAVSGLWFGSVLGLCVRIGLGRGDYGAVGCSVEWMRDWPLMRDWLQYAISRTRKITAR